MTSLLITLSCFVFGACAINLNRHSANSKTANTAQVTDPFKIEVLESKIIDGFSRETQAGDQNLKPDAKRLRLVVSIVNQTPHTLENVRYTIRLNEAAKPFIAAAIIERESDVFRVVPQGDPRVNDMTDRYINVTGFEDNWEPFITNESDLLAYHSMKLDDLPEYLQSVTVSITWRGGQQEQTLPIVLS